MRGVTATSEAGGAASRTRLPRVARRAQLLKAALDVFVAQGYHAAAMDDIAERAGVSKPVLYQHFPGKLELYLALLDQAAEDLLAAVQQALSATEDNKKRAAATTEAYFRFVHDEAGAFRLVFESDLTNEPAVRDRVDQVTRQCAEAISELIAEDAGLSREESTLLAAALVGMQQQAARYWLAEEGTLDLEDAVRLVSTLAWRGIRGFPLAGEAAPSA
jgi:AcrR family transcriptional regulator